MKVLALVVRSATWRALIVWGNVQQASLLHQSSLTMSTAGNAKLALNSARNVPHPKISAHPASTATIYWATSAKVCALLRPTTQPTSLSTNP